MAHWVVTVGVEYADIYGRYRISKVKLSGFQFRDGKNVTDVPLTMTPIKFTRPESRPRTEFFGAMLNDPFA